MTIVTIYSKLENAETLIDLMDTLVRDSDSKVFASRSDALYNDANHDDYPMLAITYQTSLSYEEVKEIVQKEHAENVCFVCEEEITDWIES